MSADDEARRRELFAHYHRTRDLAARDELVVSHLRLALHLARRFANRGISLDDLEQVASLGLLQAIDRYDPARGVEFSSFATPTITGELKRHFRDRGWAVRVPRRVQELHVRLNTLVPELSQELGRSPSIGELARAARATDEEVLEAMEAAQAYRSHSLTARPADDEDPVPDAPAVDDVGLSAAEDRLLADELLEKLPPRDQLLLRLHYLEDMTQQQIAERLGISQMQVSRTLRRAIAELRWRAELGQRG
ncbi:MAG: SigB/SigF/SigG family RNA polymerase sigma factor [Acidimicrobiales bacterium]|nr:SigB/SigF/SigG family RNA polymerase sigma factor [Acidimicrobiales bacterium]